MKKINLLIVFVLVGIIGFVSSCKNDPLSFLKPTITFLEGDQTVNQNTAVSVTGNVWAPAGLQSIVVKQKIISSGDVTTLDDLGKNDFTSDSTHTFVYPFLANDVDESFEIEVEVTDKEDNVVSKSVTVTVVIHDNTVNKSSVITLYTAPSDRTGTTDRFTSLTPTFDTYTWAEATGNESDIDMLYYNGNYDKGDANSHPHFVSPDYITTHATFNIHGDYIISGAKTTYFLKLSGADSTAVALAWSSISTDELIAAIPSIAINQTNVEWDDSGDPGTLIAFKLADGKKGLIKAGNAVDGGGTAGEFYDPTTDYITFEVIVQNEASLLPLK